MKFGDKENVDEGRYSDDTHQLSLQVVDSPVRTGGRLNPIQHGSSLVFSMQTIQRVRSSELERMFCRIREGQGSRILLCLE